MSGVEHVEFAVSNIAWSPQERDGAYALLQGAGITGLEIAPRLFLPDSADPFRPTPAEVRAALGAAEAAGVQLVSMQSLLFGVEGAQLFDRECGGQLAFVRGLERAIDLAGVLGIPNLVMGSPKQRLRPEGLSTAEAQDAAAVVFTPLADRARTAGTRIGMECNPAAYGANFLTRAEEVLDFVQAMDHPAVTVNFDIGAMHLNGVFDTTPDALSAAIGRIGHVHVSEPFLAPAPADPEALAPLLQCLQDLGYDRAVSIEMKRDDAGLAALEAALGRLAAARGAQASSESLT